jgi:hypothetical protein
MAPRLKRRAPEGYATVQATAPQERPAAAARTFHRTTAARVGELAVGAPPGCRHPTGETF